MAILDRNTGLYYGYSVDADGNISQASWNGQKYTGYDNQIIKYNKEKNDYPYNSIAEATNASNAIIKKKQDESIANLQKTYEQRLADVTSQENTRNSLASQIQALTAGGMGMQNPNAGPEFNQALSQLSAGRNYGSSDLGSMLNFQVSDQQIVDDYNNSKLSRLNSVIERGNTQIAGINERLTAANKLLADLPAGDARRTSSEVFIKQLNDDLKSVTSAVTGAQDMQKNFKPITMDSPEGLKEITAFRSFVQLPEERASQQLFQIDPDSYRTAVGLGQQYRQMATEPIVWDVSEIANQLGAEIIDEIAQLSQQAEQSGSSLKDLANAIMNPEDIMLSKTNPQMFTVKMNGAIAQRTVELTAQLQAAEASGEQKVDPLVALKQRELDLRAMDLQIKQNNIATDNALNASQFKVDTLMTQQDKQDLHRFAQL